MEKIIDDGNIGILHCAQVSLLTTFVLLLPLGTIVSQAYFFHQGWLEYETKLDFADGSAKSPNQGNIHIVACNRLMPGDCNLSLTLMTVWMKEF